MQLHSRPKTTAKAAKIVGRGYGSGKGGHTTGRGAKGQKARGKVKIWFEGGQLPLIKRLPFQRGKGRFKPLTKNPVIVNLKYLNALPKNTSVTLETLIKYKIVRDQDARKFGVKILGEGKLDRPLTIELPTSKSAAKAIIAAKGKVIAPKIDTKAKAASVKSKPAPAKKAASKVTAKSTAKPKPKATTK